MFFGLLSLGIVCSVSITLCALLSLLLIVVIFGIKVSDQILRKFILISFNILLRWKFKFSLEINSKEDIKEYWKAKM